MKRIILSTLNALLLAGCKNNDERLADMAQQHEKSQSEQSQQTARMQHEVAEGSRKLVEADAKARQVRTRRKCICLLAGPYESNRLLRI